MYSRQQSYQVMSHRFEKHAPRLLRLGDGVLRRRKYYLRTFGKAPKAHIVPMGSILRLLNFTLREGRTLMNTYRVACNYHADGRRRFVKSANYPVAPGDQLWVDGHQVLVSVDERGGLKLEESDGILRLKVLTSRRQKGGVRSLICNKGYVLRTDDVGSWVELSLEGLRVVEQMDRPGCLVRSTLRAPIPIADIPLTEDVYVL